MPAIDLKVVENQQYSSLGTASKVIANTVMVQIAPKLPVRHSSQIPIAHLKINGEILYYI
jgi:hypothetical protein